MHLPVGPDAPRQARRELSELLENWPEDALCDVKLLVSELVTNSVLHAGLSPTDRVEVGAVLLDDGAVRVTVVDSGLGLESAGLGLRFVEQLSRSWGIEDAGGVGTCVWFEVAPR